MPDLYKELAAITGEENLFTAKADGLAYANTPFFGQNQAAPCPPLAAARPVRPSQLCDLLKLCSREKIQVVVRGGGTRPAPCASNALARQPLVILTTGLNRILEIDATNRIAKVQSGVACAELSRAAARHGLFFPPDPGSRELATIGGCIAANTASSNSIKYGPVGNYIINLDICTTGGQKISCAAQNGHGLAKGLPIAQLFCGSYGALGIISQATLRLLPKPQASKKLAARFASMTEAANAAKSIMSSRLTPSLLDILDSRACAAIAGSDPGDMLLLEFEGHADEVNQDSVAAAKILAQNHSVKITVEEDADHPEMLFSRKDALPVLMHAKDNHFLLDTFCCPPARLPALLEGIDNITREHGLKYAIFGHAGIARIHATIFYGKNSQDAQKAMSRIFTLELILNSAMHSEEDVALSREQWLSRQDGAIETASRLRNIFDPQGLFIDVCGCHPGQNP